MGWWWSLGWLVGPLLFVVCVGNGSLFVGVGYVRVGGWLR